MNQNLENLVLAHRYLYYCLGSPVIADFEYDKLEKQARLILPEDSPVQGMGSDSESSYSEEIKELAKKLKNE